MRISRLQLDTFRNYRHCEIEPEEALTVLIGPNGSGKTNIIEAVQMVTSGSSFRTVRWSEVVSWGMDHASVKAVATGERSEARLELEVVGDGTRQWTIDGVSKTRSLETKKLVPSVIFTPDDLTLLKGTPADRRGAIDALGDQLSPAYRRLRRDYARVLKQRNALLKEETAGTQLDAWNEKFVDLGSRLHVHRRRLARRLIKAMQPVYSQLTEGEDLQVAMGGRCGSPTEDINADLSVEEVRSGLAREVEQRRADERSRQVSLVGPHRDDLVFYMAGRDAHAYASQGQQRTVALAWKWAEVAVISDVVQRAPILLLDDVMSELDDRRRAVLTELMQTAVQTFVTATTTTYFEPALLRSAQVINVRSLH